MVTNVPHLISNSKLPLVFIYTVYKDETIYLKKHKNAETFKLSQYWSLHVYEFPLLNIFFTFDLLSLR